MTAVTPIIFSGHNERAVIALCRYLKDNNVPFFIVSRSGNDAIYRTDWRRNVVFQRDSDELSIKLMQKINQALPIHVETPAFCPTSEFLNAFILENRQPLEGLGWLVNFPDSDIYQDLSNKARSPKIIQSLTAIMPPPSLSSMQWQGPCVLKPKYNISNGKVLYPLLCNTKAEFIKNLRAIESTEWFVQKLIVGDSIYLCSYLDKSGAWSAYWQENLLQQPGGKSMVLSRSTRNPGVDVPSLMQGLHGLGYFGPFMMEIIRDKVGVLHFIEVNPRFWGPLELCRSACPSLLGRFLSDLNSQAGHCSEEVSNGLTYWYAWAFGALNSKCHVYPGLNSSLSRVDTTEMLLKYDVYAGSDTKELHNRH